MAIAPIEKIEIRRGMKLADYASHAALTPLVSKLEHESQSAVRAMRGRHIWMLNSTARGGGVAEMMPMMIALLRELGFQTDWIVMNCDRPEFFQLTKRLHNMIHGDPGAAPDPGERQLYEDVNGRAADALAEIVKPEDLLVVHDPQPLAVGAFLKKSMGLSFIWRCHIGLDQRTDSTSAAWRFLQSYAVECERAIFSAPEYIPDYLAGRSLIIHPAVDPLSHKNRELHPIKHAGVLANAGLMPTVDPMVRPPFEHQAQRLTTEGFVAATKPDHIGLLFRPMVTQVSRWDRLKGWMPLLEGFARMKQRIHDGADAFARRRMQLVRLVLAGPDPASIQDDPEGVAVLEEICAAWQAMRADVRADIVLLALPMHSAKENALMVNALQRASSIIVQNSLREGFGLTATEAMWKSIPVLASSACGLRQQIRPGIDGIMLEDNTNPEAIAVALADLLNDPVGRDRMGRSARRQVYEEFLIFTQLRRWARLFAEWGQKRGGAK